MIVEQIINNSVSDFGYIWIYLTKFDKVEYFHINKNPVVKQSLLRVGVERFELPTSAL